VTEADQPHLFDSVYKLHFVLFSFVVFERVRFALQPTTTQTMSSMAFLSHPYFFAALTCLVVQFLFRKLNKRDGKKYHPVAGTVFNQLVNFHRLHHYMTHLAAKYRTYRLINLFRYEVYTAEPSNVEYILKTNFENYGKVKTVFIDR